MKNMEIQDTELKTQAKKLDMPVVMYSSIANLKVGSKQWEKAIVKNSNYAVNEIKNRTNNEDINTLTDLLAGYVKEFEFLFTMNDKKAHVL